MTDKRRSCRDDGDRWTPPPRQQQFQLFQANLQPQPQITGQLPARGDQQAKTPAFWSMSPSIVASWPFWGSIWINFFFYVARHYRRILRSLFTSHGSPQPLSVSLFLWGLNRRTSNPLHNNPLALDRSPAWTWFQLPVRLSFRIQAAVAIDRECLLLGCCWSYPLSLHCLRSLIGNCPVYHLLGIHSRIALSFRNTDWGSKFLLFLYGHGMDCLKKE